MKFYSEITKKLYDSEDALQAEELKLAQEKEKKEAEKKALSEARSKRAKEVEKAFNEKVEAEKKYTKLVNEFIKDYGSFHMTFSNSSVDRVNDVLNDAFDFLFNL